MGDRGTSLGYPLVVLSPFYSIYQWYGSLTSLIGKTILGLRHAGHIKSFIQDSQGVDVRIQKIRPVSLAGSGRGGDMLKTLKGKISFIYLCLVILIGIVGAMSFFNLFRLSQSIDGLMTQNYKSINAVTNTMEAIERQDSAVLIYMNIDRQKGIDLFSENNASFLQWYSVEQGNITEQGEQEIVDNIKTYYMEYTKLFSNLQEIRNSQDEAASVAFYDKVMMPDFLRLKQELKSLITLNEKAMFLGRDRATQNASQSTAFILGLTALAIVGGFLLSRYFANRFLKPIYALNDAIHEIKAGNMNKQAE